MILKTVLLRHHHVAALVLGHLDLPLPGGASGPGVNVDVDLIARVGGGDPHVLASVVATDGGRHSTPRVTDSQGVSGAVTHLGPQQVGVGGWSLSCIGDRGSQHHCVKINPQLADIRVTLAEGVGAGVRVRASRVRAYDGVGVIGTTAVSAGDGEDTTNSE